MITTYQVQRFKGCYTSIWYLSDHFYNSNVSILETCHSLSKHKRHALSRSIYRKMGSNFGILTFYNRDLMVNQRILIDCIHNMNILN